MEPNYELNYKINFEPKTEIVQGLSAAEFRAIALVREKIADGNVNVYLNGENVFNVEG